MHADLGGLLRAAGHRALVILAASGDEPDAARFTGGAHLGSCFVLADGRGRAWLGYFTAMERQEAAATGLELLHPDALGIDELLRSAAGAVDVWHGAVARGLELTGFEGGDGRGSLAVAGQGDLGTLLAACRKLEADGWSLANGSELLLRARKRKTESELADLRRAAAGTCQALTAVATALAEAAEVEAGELVWGGAPLTAGRLRQLMAAELALLGLEQPHRSIVAAGASAGVPHTEGDDDRRLRAGEALVVDLFPRSRLFADCTRTFCVGEPAGVLAGAHAAVLATVEEAHRNARPAVRGWDLQKAACERLATAGYPTPLDSPGSERGYVHNLGHGVGFQLHEYPSFRRDAGEEGVLEAGDAFTLEPGLYDPVAGWGVRLEDLCLMTAGGAENLTPLPYALDPRAWIRAMAG